MNAITSREFQSNYQRLIEPVVVKAKSRTLGTWYPAGTGDADFSEVADAVEIRVLTAEIQHLKAELAKRPPLRLAVEKDGSISKIAGGPLDHGVSTGPTVSKPRSAVRAGVDRTLNNAPFTPVLK